MSDVHDPQAAPVTRPPAESGNTPAGASGRSPESRLAAGELSTGESATAELAKGKSTIPPITPEPDFDTLIGRGPGGLLSPARLAPLPLADGDPRRRLGPRQGRQGTAAERRGKRDRPRRLDWVAFALAFLLPPIGFFAGIAAAIVGKRRMGWASGVAKAATGIAVVLSIVIAVGIVALDGITKNDSARAATVASSVAFCAQLASQPGTLTSQTANWPTLGQTVPASLTTMREFEQRWTTIARVAPAGVRTGARSIAAVAQSIITSVETSSTIDDATNVSLVTSAVANSGIAAWANRYCG